MLLEARRVRRPGGREWRLFDLVANRLPASPPWPRYPQGLPSSPAYASSRPRPPAAPSLRPAQSRALLSVPCPALLPCRRPWRLPLIMTIIGYHKRAGLSRKNFREKLSRKNVTEEM